LIAVAQREGATHLIFRAERVIAMGDPRARGSTIDRFPGTVRSAAGQVVPLDVG